MCTHTAGAPFTLYTHMHSRNAWGGGTNLPNLSGQFQMMSFYSPGMNLQIARGCKLQVAGITLVRFLLPVMHAAVENQLAFLSKAFVAEFTFVWLFTCVEN